MQENKQSIKNWATDDRPREKALLQGFESVSISELLAILIQNGSKEKSAVDLGKEIFALCNNNLNELGKLSVAELTKIKGIGQAKAITICTALELGRRRQMSELINKEKFNTPHSIGTYLQAKFKDYRHEVFAVMYFTQTNQLKLLEIISEGGTSKIAVDIKVIFKKALEQEAAGIVLCHNHPDGSLNPSKFDIELTNKIKESAKLLSIRLIDHFIVSEKGYYSFANEELI